ncbi:MAG: uracil-DNA glycosylase [Chlamydiota bacterium]
MMQLGNGWQEKLREEIKKPYMRALETFLESEKKSGKLVYPPEPLIFYAFSKVSFEDVKVVIMGQDPYHGPGQAHGLSFSVPCGIAPPPSLKNIFKELISDVNISLPKSGCLSRWADQGVLLLNATLTVRDGEPKSHHGRGWEQFTDAVILHLIQREDPIVFILWGKLAQEKYLNVMQEKKHPHAVLMSAHPSPYSAKNFFGGRHFSKANSFLEKWGKKPIDWSVGVS